MTNVPPSTTGSATPELARASHWARIGYAVPWIVLVFGLIITYSLWDSASKNVRKDMDDYFDFRAREAVEKTTQRLQIYEQMLRGTQGLFKASGNVGRNEFRTYVTALKLEENYPGIQGVGYAITIPPEKKAQHIAEMHREGFPEYTVKPNGKREFYTAIIYLEPFSGRNLRAFGYDMYSESVRRQAMERARDTGLAAMSGKVQLVQEAKQNIQAGFLIYLPVYRNGLPSHSLAQRRANLVGWVYAVFRTTDLVHGIYGERAPDLDINIYDGNGISDAALMYDSALHDFGNDPLHSGHTTTRHLEVGGHTWTMLISSRPGFESRIDTGRPRLLATDGIIISLSIALLMWLAVSGRTRAIRLARSMNHELIASEQALRVSEEKLQTILDHAGIAICWASRDGKMEYLNRKFTELFGYTLEDIPTSEQWNVLAKLDEPCSHGMLAEWTTEQDDQSTPHATMHPFECAITCKNGTLKYAIVTCTRIDSRILAIFSDITDRKQAENKLQQWAQIFEHAEWGIVVGHADGQHIEFANPAFARAHGYTVEEIPQLSIAELFAPEARDALPEHIRIAHEKGHHTFETVHLRKDGSTFPVLVDITAVKGENGKVLYRAVNVQDISNIKAAEKALQDSRAILQSILDNSSYLIWLKDTSGHFIAVNQAFLRSTGRQDMHDVLGKTDADLWPEQLAKKYQADVAEVIASGKQKTTEQQALDQGRPVWMEISRTPVFDADGKLLGITGFAHDITERKAVEEEMRHQAHYDLLTELPNRILFSDRLQQAIAHAKRNKQHLAVMFLDLDHFKPVNDLFGHNIGDLVLQEVAQRIQHCVRESDTVARIGGDEFCILLPSLEKDAGVVAEKILQTLRQPFQVDDNIIHIASSIGIAIYPEDGRDETTLVKHADIAMYYSKAGGRDQYALFSPSMPRPD